MIEHRFEWDAGKAAKNFRDHGIRFEEATTVYGDEHLLEDLDLEHSEHEERLIVIGYSTQSRLLMVVTTHDMKRSGSSARGGRTNVKRSGITPSVNVRYVKFTPEEMAYEPPADTSDPKRFPTMANGRKEWEQFLSVKRGYVRLDSDIRKFFPDDRAVNDLLRSVIELVKSAKVKHKKSA